MNGKAKTAIVAASGVLLLAPAFANSKTTFLSTCFSNVCIGDSIDKVLQSNLQWVTLHVPRNTSRQEDQGIVHLPQTTQAVKQRKDTLTISYVGLSKDDLAVLSPYYFDASTTPKTTPYSRLIDLMLRERMPFLAADSGVLSALAKTTVCGALPVHGVFQSDSGLYTSVLLMPVNGKLTVVRMSRLFNLRIPDDVTDAQRDHTLFDEVAVLAKQIDVKYGTQWAAADSGVVMNKNRAESDTVAAYLTFDEVWRGGHRDVEPVMTLANRDFDNIPLQRARQFADEALAESKVCQVKTPSVAIE